MRSRSKVESLEIINSTCKEIEIYIKRIVRFFIEKMKTWVSEKERLLSRSCSKSSCWSAMIELIISAPTSLSADTPSFSSSSFLVFEGVVLVLELERVRVRQLFNVSREFVTALLLCRGFIFFLLLSFLN